MLSHIGIMEKCAINLQLLYKIWPKHWGKSMCINCESHKVIPCAQPIGLHRCDWLKGYKFFYTPNENLGFIAFVLMHRAGNKLVMYCTTNGFEWSDTQD